MSEITDLVVIEKKNAMPFSMAAVLTGWPTPTAANAKGSQSFEGLSSTGKTPEGKKVAVSLNHVAKFAGWVTPTSRDWKDSAGMTAQRDGEKRLDQLPRQAYTCGHLRLTVFGEMRTGSFVEMENGVQLNPAHSRWLMGLPHAWDESSPGWQEWQAATASADSKATETP